MGDFKVWSNIDKNRLYVVLGGFARDEEAREVADLVVGEVKKLKQGFNIVSDLRKMQSITENSQKHLSRIYLVLKSFGADTIVRVVKSDKVSRQFDLAAKEAGYSVYVAETIEEAEALLDNSNK